MSQPDPIQMHDLTISLLIAGATIAGLVWTIMWAIARSLRNDMEKLSKDRKDCATNHDEIISSIKKSVHDHHENSEVHRIAGREQAQFEALQTKIDSVKDSIQSLTGTVRELTLEVKRRNGHSTG